MLAEWTRRFVVLAVAAASSAAAGEDWPQIKFDARRSGDVPGRSVTTPLGLAGAVALSDAVLTAPAVGGGRVYVVDASGVAFCLDAATLRVVWRVATRGGPANCNNVSSPALAGKYLHFGTTGGTYYVLDAASGRIVKQIACGEPIFSAPAVGAKRVYFATLGSRVYALTHAGEVCWQWDYVKERLGFSGDRWSGQQWCKHRSGRVSWRDQFCCARDVAMSGDTLLVPAGGEIVYLADAGARAELTCAARVPRYKGSEATPTFGLSVGADGAAYCQWHRRDNTGRVEILRVRDGKVRADHVRGTQARNDMPGSLAFSSVSLRGKDVYRCRPEAGFGCCRHRPGAAQEAEPLGGYPSISSPILLRDRAVYGGLDGRLYVVPLAGKGEAWSFKTAFGAPITAPAAVCDGRVYFGCEDGYLYVLAAGGKAALPTKDLEVWRIRSRLTGKLAAAEHDWFTNYGNFANTNANAQGIRPPFRLQWIRRYPGTFKHLPVCGGGRMYTHTAEGIIFAVEQETGRLLWRRYFPGVHVSYTSPVYHKERLLVPQAGLSRSAVRCLDAATGKLIWEAPFTGSPSWSRQPPPVICGDLAIYCFGTGQYAPKGTGIFVFSGAGRKPTPDGLEIMSWLYSHDNPRYPKEHKPLVRAWNLRTGKQVWQRDFSKYGSGGDDAGLCLMDGTLYYSCFFGYAPPPRSGRPAAKGVTAALDPATGRVLWTTTKHSLTAGAALSGRDGRLYLCGYNAPDSKKGPRYVWCLAARDGSLIWRSEPLVKAINVVTVARKFLFTHAYGSTSCLIDKDTGKILSSFKKGYACTRFTVSEPYVLGANLDVIDTSDGNKVISSGPAVDVRECVGAAVSNGRIYYTCQGSGLQVCLRPAAE